MSEQQKQDAAAQADDDPNIAEYSHTAKLEKHLIPQGCAMVILVKDLTRGGEIRPVVSGSTMEAFTLLDTLTGGIIMLHQAIRYSPELVQREESRILQPGNIAIPPFVSPAGRG